MAMFIMHRDRTVTSLTGRTIRFAKGQPTHVPPEMHDEVLDLGAEPVDELPEKEAPKGAAPVHGSPEWKAAVFNAFEVIVLRNDREDFTAGGTPHNKVVSAEAGFQLNAQDRDTLWEEFKQLAPKD